MIDTVYVEQGVREHPRTLEILARFPRAERIFVDRYGEVFNRRAQNFRLQKQRPALILAHKHDGHVLPIPEGTGFGGAHEYYFSHMLNCVYDCRYCFLQGMFQSAHYVVFVNFERFAREITESVREQPGSVFFSGYDCDSLVFDGVTKFTEFFVPLFRDLGAGLLELRTKSTKISGLLAQDPTDNVVVAYSLSPDSMARRHEHGAPTVAQRIGAIRELSGAGWKVGLRFDPMIHHENYQESYRELLDAVFDAIVDQALHSVTLGTLRYPKAMFETLADLYPEERMFAKLERRGRLTGYDGGLEEEMHEFLLGEAVARVGSERVYPCKPVGVTS